MAAFEVIALDTATPQLRAPGASDTYTFPRAVEMPLGTANGVLYLNGSKVVTSGSALTFDGTNLSSTGGATFQGGPTGYGGGEVRLGTTASGQQSAISTLAVDSPVLLFDHRGTSNTGVFVWRNGTGGANELARLTSTGLGIGTTNPIARLHVGGQAASATQAILATAPSNVNFRLEALNGDTGTTSGTLQAKLGLRYNDGSTLADAAAFRFFRGAGAADGAIAFATNDTERARITSGGNFVVGTAALATTATDGFLYVPTCAGTPTGTPTTQTGTAPIVVDTTNNKLYFYSGGQWRDAGP